MLIFVLIAAAQVAVSKHPPSVISLKARGPGSKSGEKQTTLSNVNSN